TRSRECSRASLSARASRSTFCTSRAHGEELSAVIIELDGGSDMTPGRDRRHVIAIAFALSLAIGSGVLGSDAPTAAKGSALPSADPEPPTLTNWSLQGYSAATAPAATLSLPPDTADVLLSFIPE